MRYKLQLSSFSLVEVLIFVTVLSLFFVVAAAVVTASLRNMQIAQHKILATRYSQELLEYVRGEKESDWNSFLGQAGTFCFSATPINNWGTNGTCSSGQTIDGLFNRSIVLNRPGGSAVQMNVTINTIWNEAGNTYNAPISTSFFIWE